MWQSASPLNLADPHVEGRRLDDPVLLRGAPVAEFVGTEREPERARLPWRERHRAHRWTTQEPPYALANVCSDSFALVQRLADAGT